MPPEENPIPEAPVTPEASQPVPESPAPELPSPAVEVPVEAPVETPAPAIETIEPTAPPAEAPPVPEEAVPAPETAQIPPNEPLAPESEPIIPASAPVATPEPPPSPTSPGATQGTARQSFIGDLLDKARVAIQDRKRKKRDKIMQALTTNPTSLKLRRAGQITNDEVEKLLHVSDATATRYLSALEKEGKIIQVGTKGKGILYIKTP